MAVGSLACTSIMGWNDVEHTADFITVELKKGHFLLLKVPLETFVACAASRIQISCYSRFRLKPLLLVLRQVVSERVSPVSAFLSCLIMGDREADVPTPITRADLDAQNQRIDNLTNQFGEMRELLLQALGGNNRRGGRDDERREGREDNRR
ncbi:hypothetical protein L3X38_019050 [Prunus dulcis]|uniref:Uncharacterized protein n=1 Tax=Prunus dulcis TaxID=3755 RepID=A0AAD4WB52_PRUDU|nr:hypothetical protein L3X38_019050 [Prunus dulcis]